jgi:hypothetical protein
MVQEAVAVTDHRVTVGTEVAEVVPTVQEEMETEMDFWAVGAVRAAIVHTTQARHEAGMAVPA